MLVEYDCIQCGTHVKKARSPANIQTTPRFCSQKCHGAYVHGTGKGTQPNVEYTCVVCGKVVKTYRSPAAQENTIPKYCSVQCTGAAQRGEDNPAWSGGRHKLNTGYVVRLAPGHPFVDARGYVLEHRLVMEQIVGRYLTKDEVVHHVNGVKDDNRPENLQLFPDQATHIRHHYQTGKVPTDVR
jgi:hypothetical protein